MKSRTNRFTGVIAILVVLLFVGMTFPATANHGPEKGKKDSKSEPMHYIGLGIGDHLIRCFGDTLLAIDSIDSINVTVNDGMGGTIIDGDEEFPGSNFPDPVGGGFPTGGTPPINIGTPGDPLCLGGAINMTTGETTTDVPLPEQWTVWAEDYTYKLIRQATFGEVDIVPSMFGRIELEAVRQNASVTSNCVLGDPAGSGGNTPNQTADVCDVDGGTETQSKVLTQFSVCGKAHAHDLNDGAWQELANDKFGGTPAENLQDLNENYTFSITKSVFMDGPIFFSLDCTLFGGGTPGLVVDQYNDMVCWWNNQTPPSAGECGLFDPNVPRHPVCNPGLPIVGFVCLFPFPAGDSKCWEEGDTATGVDPYRNNHTAAFIGLIGEIGWNHDQDMECGEPTGEGPWVKNQEEGGDPDCEFELILVNMTIHDDTESPGSDEWVIETSGSFGPESTAETSGDKNQVITYNKAFDKETRKLSGPWEFTVRATVTEIDPLGITLPVAGRVDFWDEEGTNSKDVTINSCGDDETITFEVKGYGVADTSFIGDADDADTDGGGGPLDTAMFRVTLDYMLNS